MDHRQRPLENALATLCTAELPQAGRMAKAAMRLALLAAIPFMAALHAPPAQAKPPKAHFAVTDAALLRTLPGFESGVAEVNGTRIHYVIGGRGEPLVLLPGWPQTWWEYHRVMAALAREFRVIVVDLRGMGSSSRPAGGYDKKTMARDVFELVSRLGYRQVNIAGHDIGSMVAFSFAANYPQATRKLALMEVPHPDEFFSQLRMLPEIGKFGATIDDQHPGYPWWFAFHQVKGLPERVLAGRFHIYQDFLLDYLLRDPKSIDARDRAVYHAAYASADAIRAGDAWYQAFMQDAIDIKTYPKLLMPVLGLGSTGYAWLQAAVPPVTTDFRLVKVEDSGHFIADEQPDFVTRALLEFFR
jgi:pimeloyl-ACP methyl ester carboxylesterase